MRRIGRIALPKEPRFVFSDTRRGTSPGVNIKSERRSIFTLRRSIGTLKSRSSQKKFGVRSTQDGNSSRWSSGVCCFQNLYCSVIRKPKLSSATAFTESDVIVELKSRLSCLRKTVMGPFGPPAGVSPSFFMNSDRWSPSIRCGS